MQVAWLKAAIYALAAYRSAGHPRATGPYTLFLKSTSQGTVRLLRKLCSGRKSLGVARVREIISDESPLAALRGYLEIVRTINGGVGRILAERDPNYVNKYMKEYLARGFSKKNRREILKFHHTYLSKYVRASFYNEILENEPVLWRESIVDKGEFTISISFNERWHSEGDLSLIFKRNDVSLYEVSFTVVPGDVIGSGHPEGLVIGRIQGRKGEVDAIRASTKAYHDIAPPYLLLAATQSIARVLGINIIAGVSNFEHIAQVWSAREWYFDYDAFWVTLSAQKNVFGMYELPIPFLEKPMEQITATHRRRTRRKRQLKRKVEQTVGATFAATFLSER